MNIFNFSIVANYRYFEFCTWRKHCTYFVTITAITCIKMSKEFYQVYIINSISKNFISILWKCSTKPNSIFCALSNLIMFFCDYHFLGKIDKIRGSHFEIQGNQSTRRRTNSPMPTHRRINRVDVVCLTSNKLYWIDDQLADVSTRFYTSASWRRRVGPSASWP